MEGLDGVELDFRAFGSLGQEILELVELEDSKACIKKNGRLSAFWKDKESRERSTPTCGRVRSNEDALLVADVEQLAVRRQVREIVRSRKSSCYIERWFLEGKPLQMSE